MPGTGDPIFDSAVGYAMWYLSHPVPGIDVASQLASHVEHGQNLTPQEIVDALHQAQQNVATAQLAASNANMSIGQAYANASGNAIAADQVFGLRVFFVATLENGLALEMSVLVDAPAGMTSAEIAKRVGERALAGEFTPRTGSRYKIMVVGGIEIFSVIQGGAYGPTMSL